MTTHTQTADPKQTTHYRTEHKSILNMAAEVAGPTYMLIAVCAFLLFIAAWFLATIFGTAKPTFLPSPLAVIASLGKLADDETLASHVGNSVYRIIVGFLIAFRPLCDDRGFRASDHSVEWLR